MSNKTQYKLQVGKPYKATDTNVVFVASKSDVHGAWLANSEHLYEEVKGVNTNAVKRSRWRYLNEKEYLAALTEAAKLDASN